MGKIKKGVTECWNWEDNSQVNLPRPPKKSEGEGVFFGRGQETYKTFPGPTGYISWCAKSYI